MNWLRDIMYSLGIAATSPVWGWRLLRTGKWRTDWKQRFGHVPAEAMKSAASSDASDAGNNADNAVRRATVLIHAVSVGEVNATRQLVELLANDPANPCDIVISCTTNTGIARARSLYEPTHRVVRFPFDFSRSVKRFLNAVKPDLVVLIELEIWPTFVNYCAKRGVPVAVANGRLSERSFKRYKLIRPLMRSAFAKLSAAAVQTPLYAEHFKGMGCVADRVTVTDTMKWDTAVIEEPADVVGAEALAAALGIDRSKPLVVAGSTGPKEEWLLMKEKPADVQLLIAPRKPERFKEVELLIGFVDDDQAIIRRTDRSDGCDVPALCEHAIADIFLLDTMGELRKAYALADAVIVGRSLVDLYGSDPIEPIALGKPTVIGPRYSDFRDIVDAFVADDGIVVSAEPWEAIRAILDDPAYASKLGEAGRQTIRQRQGATEKHVALIQGLLKERPLRKAGKQEEKRLEV